MKNRLHTVLGGSGATGRAVIKELQRRNLTFNAVERTKKLENTETIKADLLNEQEAVDAIRHSDYVYLCVGLPYNADLWAKDWPKLMKNVIMACEKADARLIFLDNVYLYGNLQSPFDEAHPQNPVSKKGNARKQTADLLIEAVSESRVKAAIGRSADFYGENALNSPFYTQFLENMLKGKAPQTLGRKGTKHTYANVSDNGRALVALALDEEAYGHVWHLPTAEAVDIATIGALFNKALGTDYEVSYLPKFMRKILSLFVPTLKEVEEMMYQFETDYVMDSSKFRAQFPDFEVTSYEQGIEDMARSFKS